MMRFGLMKEALFINANIDLYSDRSEKPLSGKRSANSTENEPLSFKYAISAKILAALPMKKVVALQFSPIRMRLHHSGRVEMVVMARRASINPKTREMVFTGDVRWTRGGNILYADHLTASLEENTIRVQNNHFRLRRDKAYVTRHPKFLKPAKAIYHGRNIPNANTSLQNRPCLN